MVLDIMQAQKIKRLLTLLASAMHVAAVDMCWTVGMGAWARICLLWNLLKIALYYKLKEAVKEVDNSGHTDLPVEHMKTEGEDYMWLVRVV